MAATPAFAAEPIRPKIARCRLDAEWVPGSPELGKGNSPERRPTWIDFGYFTRSAADDGAKASVLAATDKIEVCYRRPARPGQPAATVCPGSDPPAQAGWVLFDRSVDPTDWIPELLPGQPRLGGPDVWILDHGVTGAAFKFRLPVGPAVGPAEWVDWGDPAGRDAGKVFFLRVNGEADADAVGQGGWCPAAQHIFRSGSYALYAAPSDIQDPWGGGLAGAGGPTSSADVCESGNRAQDLEWLSIVPVVPGGALMRGEACVDRDAAPIALDLLRRVDEWQELRSLRAVVDPDKPLPSAYNGTSPSGAPYPFYFLSYPDKGGHSLAGGGITIPPATVNPAMTTAAVFTQGCVTDADCSCAPGAPSTTTCPNSAVWPLRPANAGPDAIRCDTALGQCRNIDHLSRGAGALARLIAHEQFHTLQNRFNEDRGAGLALAPAFFEQAAPAIETALCLPGYPGVATNARAPFGPDYCVSPRRLGFLADGVAGLQLFLGEPKQNPLVREYYGVVFWRYVLEQFAIPPSAANPSHPDGPISAFPARPLDELAFRDPDEGADLLGRAMDGFVALGGLPAEDALDSLLVESLGRSFGSVVLDMHTAALLKDYKDSDPRWRFEWVGDYTSGASPTGDPLSPVPGAAAPAYAFLNDVKPFAVPPDLYLSPSAPDGLPRARRKLDSHLPCAPAPCAPPFDTLAAGQTVASPFPIDLEDLGAAYLSVAPAPGYGNMIMRFRPFGGALPRVRVFIVPSAPPGVPFLASGCDVDPDGANPSDTERCATVDGNVDLSFHVPPAGSPGAISEVLAVVSADRHRAMFKYRFGDLDPAVTIISPTQAQPAEIGNPLGTDPTRPFLLQFSVLDRYLEGIGGLDSRHFKIEVPGCPAASCEIPGVHVAQVAGGIYWAAVSVPPTHFPALGTRLDVSVTFNQNGATASALEPRALTSNSTATPLLAMLVLDRSGSMEGAKLQGLRDAALLAIGGLLDTDELGIVTYDNDAQTVLPLLPLGIGHRGAAAGALAAMEAGGWTSIGDGLFEAQTLLAERQDAADPADPRRHVMLLLSDGRNNRSWAAGDYYLGDSPNPTTDGTDTTGPPDPDTYDNATWPPRERRWLARLARGLMVPQIHTVALGQDAALIDLQNIADTTGGVFTYAANHHGIESTDVTLELSDVFRTGINATTGHQRVFGARVASTAAGELPEIQVEPFATELLVSVGAPEEGADPAALELVAPSGAVFAPAASTPTTAVFRVASPEPGAWTFVSLSPASATGHPTVFVEQAVRSGLVLFAQADSVDAATPGAIPEDNGRTMGSWVTIRAVLAEKAPVYGASVIAEVTPPDSPPFVVELLDDGRGYDGASGDGIHAVTLRATGKVGSYRVRIVATGTAPGSNAAFRREAHLAFELHETHADQDVDGLPDVWEERHGTQVAIPDADADPDGDGLTNEEELQAGTEPWQSDSDFGGESDLSELVGGRDPFRPEDDQFPRFTPTLCPGNGKVTVVPNLPFPAELVNFELQEVTASGDRGPVTRVIGDIIVDPGYEVQEPFQPPPPVELVAPNEEEFCVEMRMRGFAFGSESGFSPTRCATPREDPYEPEVRVELPDLAGRGSRTRDVRLVIHATDQLQELEEACRPRDPAAVTTGVTDVRVSDRADFAGAGWEPFTPARSVWLPDQPKSVIWVQVRDGAGNVSRPVYVIVELVSKTPLDEVIRSDERALDLLVAGSFAPAVREIAAGMASFLGSLETVRRRATPARLAEPIDTTLLAELQTAHAWKRTVLSAGGPRRVGDAAAALREALVHERYAAQLAADTGREL